MPVVTRNDFAAPLIISFTFLLRYASQCGGKKIRMIDDGIQLVCSERVYGNADEVQSRDIGCKLNNPVHHGTADVLDCLGVGNEALGEHLRFGVGNNMAKNNTRRRVAVEYIIYTYDRRHNKVFNQQLSDCRT